MATNIVNLSNFRRLCLSSRTLRITQNLRVLPVPSISVSKKYTTKSAKESKDNLDEKHGQEKKNALKSSSVPTSRISRLFHYGSLAAGVGMNAAAKGISEVAKGNSPTWKSLILSDSNIDKITNKFSKMRGVALKIGQILSFQDEKVLPKELYEILSRVQNSANHMPQRQLERVMARELGADWNAKFSRFDKVPMAAASIGQVHAAELLDGQRVVVKIQYPGVKESIDSDLNSLLTVSYTHLDVYKRQIT